MGGSHNSDTRRILLVVFVSGTQGNKKWWSHNRNVSDQCCIQWIHDISGQQYYTVYHLIRDQKLSYASYSLCFIRELLCTVSFPPFC